MYQAVPRSAATPRAPRQLPPISSRLEKLTHAQPECPVCHIEISIDLEAEPIDLTEGQGTKARQGILSRLNLDVSYLFASGAQLIVR